MLIHIVLSLTLILNLPIASQKSAGAASSKRDFSGYWNALILKSDDEPIITLKISYSEPKLEITRMVTFREPTIVMGQSLGTSTSNRFVYYTDGRGETQKSIPTLSGESTKSKTERIGDKFVTTSVSRSKDAAGNMVSDHTTTLEVSSEGKTLTQTNTSLAEGNRRRVHRYDRRAGNNTTDINGEWVERSSNRLISLTVEHREPEIKVTRREVTETQDESGIFVHYTDGRGETNMEAGRPMKSVTKWKDQTLVFALSSKSKIAGDTIEIRQTIKWQFTKDDRLVEVSQSSGSAGGGILIPPGPSTLVFARSAKPLR